MVAYSRPKKNGAQADILIAHIMEAQIRYHEWLLCSVWSSVRQDPTPISVLSPYVARALRASAIIGRPVQSSPKVGRVGAQASNSKPRRNPQPVLGASPQNHELRSFGCRSA